jgi:hypothetical protein
VVLEQQNASSAVIIIRVPPTPKEIPSELAASTKYRNQFAKREPGRMIIRKG